jgi:hypothetical protein
VFSIAFPNMSSPWRRENPTVGAPYSVGDKSWRKQSKPCHTKVVGS